ncbi:IclR family transcriptional regulator [Gordonia sp. NPDC127522]|uniref:IclR family transcriptional regulator n=1 Tax=Gordonia sp. NPDC127522 TaxID=3345390 RepID=UPI0036261036
MTVLAPPPVKDQPTIPSSMVERMTLIMDCFDCPQSQLHLESVVQTTGLPRSTAHRILEQLVRMTWLDRNADLYSLGPRSLGLGGREIGHSALRAAAAPVLHDIAVRTDLVVHLGVLDGNAVYYLDKLGGRRAVEIPSRVGGRAPAHATALGKAMLAWLEPEHVDDRFHTLSARTPQTVSSLGALHQNLNHIRRNHGLSFERGECFPNIACAGIALRGPAGPLGAISIVGAAHDNLLHKHARLLVEAAHKITQELVPADPNSKPFRRAQSVPAPPTRKPSWNAESIAGLLPLSRNQDWL